MGGGSNWINLLVHFVHRHALEIEVILEEEYRTYPRWPQCDMLVPQKALNGQHTKTAF